ncbi:MAG: PIN domain-containing protein [Candidatus Dormibacteria bacterium]
MALTTVDTSVLVAALQRWHAAHRQAAAVLRGGEVRIGAHVLAETFATLTGGRLQPRAQPRDAFEALMRFGEVLTLSAGAQLAALRRCAEGGCVGGAVYDALVAATAREAGAHLVSRDRRAARTYDLVGVDYELIV